MLKEKDKDAFYRQLQLFRNNLASHGQHKLLQYFEDTYFPEHRIKQWATWYRQSMYDCEWLADTNMHVESWHNYLKTHILHRKSNVRVDKLMRALRQAENIYYWKWSRVRSGWVTNAHPGWIKMLGLSEKNDVPDPVNNFDNQNIPCTVVQRDVNSVTSRSELLLKKWVQVHKVVTRADLSSLKEDTIGFILKHLNAIKNLLNCKEDVPKNLITSAIIADQKQKVIPRVIEQYKFPKKRPRLMRNSTSVKSFRCNSANRSNRVLSFQLSTESSADLQWDSNTSPEFDVVKCTLPIVRSKKGVSLGGISFSPMIGGKMQ